MLHIMWVRTQRQTVTVVRKSREAVLFEVIRFLVLPDKCLHKTLEHHVENPATYNYHGPCRDMCSFCTGQNIQLSGMISKTHLISALTTSIFNKSAVRADKLVALLTNKTHINTIKKNKYKIVCLYELFKC